MIGLNKIGLNQVQLNRLRLNAPFPAYGKMAGGGGSGDGFPVLPGDVTRWHFGGLTNEMMAAMDDPRIEDADGKGRFLSFKNFAWGGMSGVNGYVQNFNDFRNNATVDKIRIDEQSSNSIKVTILTTGIGNAIYIVKNIYQFNKSYFIKISSEGYNEGDLSLSFYAPSTSTATTVKVPLNPNGITEIPAIKEDDFLAVYLNVGGKVGSITIEQLPLYPGFILGDGVDDEAATENLDLEDTYTVYTPLILLKYGGVVSGKSRAKDFSLNTVVSSKSIGFDSANAWSGSIPVDLFEFALVVCKRDPKTMYVKDLITGKANQSNSKEFVPNPGKYFIWRNTGGSWCQVAIAGQIICNGHFSTDEDDEKVLDWYKKQYPWLFFDQAWTVVGKINEDEDRAIIANITGNGNDLVLSNFAFSGNSGYGSYVYNFNDTSTWIYYSYNGTTEITSSTIHVTEAKTARPFLEKNTSSSGYNKMKIKVTGIKDGEILKFMSDEDRDNTINIEKDGIYSLPGSDKLYYGFRLSNSTNTYPFNCDITIEQIPEYEGYLVTDGVDDRVVSSSFTLNKDWTIVGNWKMLQPEANKLSGIVKQNSLFIYNHVDGLNISINDAWNFFKLKDIRSVNAICSDGRIYLNDWTEIIDSKQQTVNESVGTLVIGILGNVYTSLAFKNLGFYNNQNLSKDDCIKAYNYLQTLKAK